jgi:intein/homing endonuclease
MTGHAYEVSARTASRMGPFAGFAENREHMLRVLRQHQQAASRIDEELVEPNLLSAAQESWDIACELGERYGVRNSQASVLAPTGTIGLMMDCDTTGIEPDLGLVKTKKLVGGGTMSIVNQTVPRALEQLGYGPGEIDEIVAYIDEHKSILGAPHLMTEHLPVFACSMGDNTIQYTGHVRMMAAVQPFISGAISKCVVGDTLVASADGLIRIGDLHNGEAADSFRSEIIEVASLDGTQKTDAFYYGGFRDVLEVTLRSGQRIVGTPNHRLMVAVDGGLDWRRLGEIDVDDMVAVHYGAELWSALPARFDDFRPTAPYGFQKVVTIPTEMTEELAFLLGAYAAEGHTTRSNWTVRITNSVPEVRDRIVAAWRSQFGVNARIADDGVRCPDVVVSSKTVVEFLEHLGCGARASAKRIPDAVLRSPRPMVLAFMQGVALDAYVTNSTAPKWAICLDAPRLLDDLQSVLANLGIVHSRVTEHNSIYDKDFDEVYATGEDAQHLLALVPFLEPDKCARADELCARVFSGHDTADVVPGITPRDLYDMLPRGRSGRGGHGVRGEFAYLCDPRTQRVTRRTVERVAAVPGATLPSWLRTVVDDGLHFSPVTAVHDAGVREVYDIAVPATQAFVGNGIVNHNTVNMPEDVSVEDVEQLHIDAWRMGVKAIAIYRDNCKVGQPLSTTKKEAAVSPGAGSGATQVIERIIKQPVREKLPRNRSSKTFEFRVADCKGFVTVGEYTDGRPGEIFLKVSKQGSTLAGIMDAFSISVSYGLQYGVPLRNFVEAFTNTRFEPAGITDDAELRIATSILDYIFRRLAVDYLSYEERAELGILTTGERTQPTLPGVEETVVETRQGQDVPADPPSIDSSSPTLFDSHGAPKEPSLLERAGVTDAGKPTGAPNPAIRPVVPSSVDAPYCMQCGVQMQRAGSCHACPSCGSTSGCS